jgi:glycosyltransferase involved in cell wall biosynthesis
MKKSPLISIITVVRNNKYGILRTLKSIELQSFKDFEHIIIDGASDDGTLDVVKNFSNLNQILISENDNGIYDAMNKGIKIAKGDYIAFLNSGDWYDDNTLILASNILLENNKIDILHGLLAYYDSSLNLEFILGDSSMNLAKRMIQHPTCFVKSNLYKENLYDLTYKSASDYNSFIMFYFNKCNFHFSSHLFTHFVNDGISQNVVSRIETLDIKRKYNLISNKKYFFLLIFYKLNKLYQN